MFDPAFLAKLERLHLLSRRRVSNGQHRAERRSRKLGSSLEFADHRRYSPGDDLRSVDWNLSGRLDKLFLKRFEEEEDLHVSLLVDSSASMRWTPPPGGPLRPAKLDLARRIAGTLAYVGLAGLDRVNAGWFAERLGPDLGSGRGRSHFHRVAAFLDRLPPEAGQTDLARSLRAFGQRTARRGLVIVLSDFFDPRGYEEALSYLLYQRFEVRLIQVLDPAELRPSLRGDVRLADTETGSAYDVTVHEGLANAYEREVQTFLAGLDTFCRRRGIGCRRALTDVPYEDFVVGMLRGGGGLVG